MAQRRTIVRNGRIVSMDEEIGNLARADVLIEEGLIVAIGPDLDAGDAEVIDAEGKIVAPGLIDTHRHTWQTQIRGLCADWTLGDYIAGVRFTIAPSYTPDDVYLGNRAGAIEAVDAGVTTILDFSHCNSSPDHSDAALRGLRDAGIRAVFAYGFFDSSPAAPQYFGAHEERVSDFHRIADEIESDGEGRISVGVALTEPGIVSIAETQVEVLAARARDALVVTHTACVWGLPSGIPQMEERGLLDARQVHVHCNALDDEEWATLASHGAKISISPETELNMGMGRLVFAQAKKHGIKPTLSADVVSLNSGDLFHQLRMGLAFARWADTEHVNLAGSDPVEVTVTAHEALTWVTVNAAEALGMGDRIGSLTVGKQADLILVGGRGMSQHPAADPEATLVFQTSASDVETVLVGGEVLKRDGVLVGVDRAGLAADLERSAHEVLGRISDAGRELPGTPPGGMFPAIAGLTAANLHTEVPDAGR